MTTRNQDGDPKMPNFQEQLNSAPIGTKHPRTREPIGNEENPRITRPDRNSNGQIRPIEERENTATGTLQNKT